jgi:hypothetical protein
VRFSLTRGQPMPVGADDDDVDFDLVVPFWLDWTV